MHGKSHDWEKGVTPSFWIKKFVFLTISGVFTLIIKALLTVNVVFNLRF